MKKIILSLSTLVLTGCSVNDKYSGDQNLSTNAYIAAKEAEMRSSCMTEASTMAAQISSKLNDSDGLDSHAQVAREMRLMIHNPTVEFMKVAGDYCTEKSGYFAMKITRSNNHVEITKEIRKGLTSVANIAGFVGGAYVISKNSGGNIDTNGGDAVGDNSSLDKSNRPTTTTTTTTTEVAEPLTETETVEDVVTDSGE